jgi:undecaprenyl diphosphate synthase
MSAAPVTSATRPRHVAIIMDGNGRWAEARGLPRHQGHRAGIEPVRMSVRSCAESGVELLTLFAFSSENWRRPATEVSALMELFMEALTREIAELDQQGVQLAFIGNRHELSVRLQSQLLESEERTRANRGLKLRVAVGYGGRWDIVEAARKLARECASGALRASDIDEERLGAALALGTAPDPDLFIRTGGERRISNFLLWNLAYAELYFTDVLWPDFDRREFDAAIEFYAGRDRRFGLTATQVKAG